MADAYGGGDTSARRKTDDPRELLGAAYDAYAGPLYRYALALLLDRGAAEDAVHQAFVKVVRMGRRALAIDSCADYLRTAVRNECWRMIDKRRRRPREVDLTSAEVVLEASPGGGLDADERAKIEAALRQLPPEQREVVHLKVYEGSSFQHIADLLGVSINTAASRYRYAMDKLRHGLGRQGDREGCSSGPG